MLAVLDIGALDLLGGLVALHGFDAVGEPAHLDLGGGRALAGEEALGRQHAVELPVEFQDVALAHGACDDLHVKNLMAARAARACRRGS